MVTLLSLWDANFLSHQHWLKIKGITLSSRNANQLEKHQLALIFHHCSFVCLLSAGQQVCFLQKQDLADVAAVFFSSTVKFSFSAPLTHTDSNRTQICIQKTVECQWKFLSLEVLCLKPIPTLCPKIIFEGQHKKNCFHILKLFENLRFDLFH